MDATLPADFDALIATHPKPVLVDFWADWCGPCHALAPVVRQLAREWKESVTVIKVDTEAKPGLARRFRISALPTVVLFKGGREAHRASGAMPLAALKSEFGPHLGL